MDCLRHRLLQTRSVGSLLVLALAACDGVTGPDITGNIDRQIDGEPEGEQYRSTDVQLCLGNAENLYAVWIDNRRDFFDVWFNRSSDGGESWLEAPIQVKAGAGDAFNVHMACNGERVYVAWEDTRDSDVDYTNIYVNFSNDGGDNWLKNDRLVDTFDPEGRQISSGPRIAFRGPNVHVVWFDQIEGAPDIYISSSENSGGEWKAPLRLSGLKVPVADGGGLDPSSAGTTWSGNPELTVDEEGRVHVVWEDKIFGTVEGARPEGAQDILYTRSDDNLAQSFRNWARVSRGSPEGRNFSFGPRVATSGENVWITWSDDRNGDGLDVFALHSSDGGGTFPPEVTRLDEGVPGGASSRYPEIAAANGVAHVVWQDDENGGYDIYYRQLVGPTPSESAVRLDNGNNLGASNSLRPTLAMSETTMAAGWLERRANVDAGFNEIMYNASDAAGGSWAGNTDWRLDTVAGGTSFSTDLRLAVLDDTVLAAWVDYRDGAEEPDIRFSRTVAGQPVLTAEAFAAQQGGATP